MVVAQATVDVLDSPKVKVDVSTAGLFGRFERAVGRSYLPSDGN
jgi:hypothetical protein